MPSDRKSKERRQAYYDPKTLNQWRSNADPDLWERFLGSAGYVSGGEITDNEDGTIDVAAGIGFFRVSDSQTAGLLLLPWPAVTNQTITTDTIRWVGVEYNAGSPQVVIRTSDDFDGNTDWALAQIANEGDELHIDIHRTHGTDTPQRLAEYLEHTYHIQRADADGGIILGELGTRNPTVTEGLLFNKLHRFPIAALDLSGADTMDRYYRNSPSGWVKEAGESQWPNTQYDDGSGTLATMIANRWAALYFYIESDGQLVMMYGQAQYVTEAAAEADAPPSTVPDRIVTHALLIGRMIFQKSAATATVESVFAVVFASAGVTSHADLANVTSDQHHSESHTLLDGDQHTDTTTGTPVNGDIITVQLGEWARLAATPDNAVLRLGLGGPTWTLWNLNLTEDVVITVPGDNDLLAYDSGSGNWLNQTAAEAGLAATGHTHQLSDLTDVGDTTPTDSRVLRADGDSWESAQLAAIDLSNGVTGTGAVVLASGASLSGPFLASPNISGDIINTTDLAISLSNLSATTLTLRNPSLGSFTLDVLGDITVSGTVDGRDVAADGTTLDTAILDADFSTDGLMTRTAAGTYTSRSIAVVDAKLTVSNGDGVSGDPTLGFGSVAASDLSNGVTGTGAVVLATSASMTTPSLIQPYINVVHDTSANTILAFVTIAGSVNYFNLLNAATGDGPALIATGTDTDIAARISGKGNGGIEFSSGGLADHILILSTVAIPVNELTITNAATGDPVKIEATGGDTDIGIVISSKGSDAVSIPGIGDGGLTNYDLKVGDTTTPDYGMIQIGDGAIGRTSYTVGSINLDGAILYRNIGGPVNGSNIEHIFTESDGNTCRFALPRSGVGFATYNPRSMLIAGPAPADTDFVKVSYWQGQGIFDNLVCDTALSGAELGVQGNVEFEETLFVDVIAESTSGAGVTVDGRDVGADGALLDTALQNVSEDTSPSLGGNLAVGGNYLDWAEMSAPANPGANVARMYCRDDSGRTGMFYRDSAGLETPIGVEEKFRTGEGLIHIHVPDSGDFFEMRFVGTYPKTVKKVWAVTDTGTVTFQVSKLAFGSPGSGGTTMLSSSMVADSTGVSTTSFSGTDNEVGTEMWIAIDGSATSGSPQHVWIAIELEVD